MKRFSALVAGLVAAAGSVSECAAQGTDSITIIPAAFLSRPPSCSPYPPAPSASKPAEPGKPPQTPAQAPTTPDPGDTLPDTGRYKSSYGQGTAVSAGAGIGAAVASAAAGFPIPANNARVATVTTTSGPLIMPGLFTAASVQSVLPVDRVSIDYGYFNRFAIAGPAGTVPGFNLNQFNLTAEKAFLDGAASIYVSVPFLYATQNVSGQQIDGLGDVYAGGKLVLFQDRETGNTLTAGMTVAAPTAHSATVTTTNVLNIFFTGGPNPNTGAPTVPGQLAPVKTTSTITVNPTFLQPWIGGLYTFDRFFIQEYFGVLVPTDNRVSTIINNNVTIGYNLYRNEGAALSAVTPVFGVQMLLPVNHIGNSVGATTSTASVNIPCTTTAYPLNQLPAPSNVTFPDQVFLSGGAQFGIADRALFSANLIVPVVGPRGYSVGATFGLTYFY